MISLEAKAAGKAAAYAGLSPSDADELGALLASAAEPAVGYAA